MKHFSVSFSKGKAKSMCEPWPITEEADNPMNQSEFK